MRKSTPFFWTCATQASERLRNSVILYDGTPCQVIEVTPEEGGVPRALLSLNGKTVRKKLDSPKFGKFRVLPTVGWINNERRSTAMFVERRVITTRQHGLSNNNCNVYEVSQSTSGVRLSERDNFSSIWETKGFADASAAKYPSMVDVLTKIVKGTSIAFSPLYCVFKDSDGVRWLFRGKEKIGLFTGTSSLLIFSSKKFYREELQEEPSSTLTTIQEF